MSIYLTPIPEEIRRSLHEREESLKKSSVNKSASNTITRDGSDPSYTFYPLGTVYIKLFSPVKTDSMPDGAMLMGGEMSKENDEWKMKHGFDDMYTSPQFDSTGKNAKVQNNPFRPMPGVESLDISYKGGMKAIREGTIKWSCFSLEDLDRLTPHFLSIGKSVLVEWGWVDTSVSENSFDQKTLINSDTATLYAEMRKRVLASKGNMDVMRGIIKNFDWQLRDDGGFDCTTNIVSLGVNITGASSKSEVECDYETVVKDGKEVVLKPKVNLGTYIKTLNDQLRKLVNNKEFSDKGILYFKKDGSGFRSDADAGPYVTWGWMEDNILSKFLGKVGKANKDIKGIYSGNPNDILAQIRSISNGKSVVIGNHKWLYTPNRKKFILPGQWPATTLIKTPMSDAFEGIDKVFEIKAYDDIGADMKEAASEAGGIMSPIDSAKAAGEVLYKKTGEAITETMKDVSNFIEEFTMKKLWEATGDSFDEKLTRELAIKANTFDSFAVSDKLSDGGYLRNILLHWEFIRDSFQNADTIEAGLKTMFSKMNEEVGNFWDFQMVNSPEDERIIQIVDMNLVAKPVKTLLNEKSKLDLNSGKAVGSLFEFKVWTEGSLVSSQNMTSRVPSAMAVSAMYGSNKQTPEEGGEQDNVTGNAIGTMSSDKKDATLYPVAPAWKFPNFGNPYDDPNDNLTLDKGPMLGNIEFEVSEEETKRRVESSTATTDTDKLAAKDKADPEGFSVVIQALSLSEANKSEMTVSAHLYDEDGIMKKHHKQSMIAMITGAPTLKSDENDKTQTKPFQDALLPIDLSLSMDGIGGILPGNVFTTSFIPVRYKKTVVFQVKDIKHSVKEEGWDVEINGQIRTSQRVLKDVVSKQEEDK